LCDNVPTFTLNAERSLDGSPSLSITFPDGYTDTLILNKYYSNAEDELVRMAEKEHCNFFGKLAKEDVCVAMTGCPGKDNLEFTIFSSHAKNGGLYRWNKDGNVQVIESQFGNLSLALFRDEDDYDYDEDELLVDPKIADLEAQIEDLCWNGTVWNCEGGATSRTIVPTACNQKSHLLAYRVGYDTKFMNKAGGKQWAEYRISQAFTHIQAYYCHWSLGTKIQFQRHSIKHYNENWCAHDATGCLKYACRHNSADMRGVDDMVYFTHDDNAKVNGVAWVSTVCGGNHLVSNMCSLNIYQESALDLAGTVAHEIGHNLGMNHDHADVHKHKCKGKGLMSYGDHPNVWSSCSVADFNAHYTANKVRWCMPESSSACGGGGYSGCKSFESKPTAPSSSSCSWWQWWC